MRINHQVNAPQVRLIGADGSQVGIVSAKEALAKAQEAELDLVEIVPDAKPPVCRIMNYGKYLFELSKRSKKKAKQIHVKEIKMRPATDVGDYQVKLRKAITFLEDGDKVKITIRFRGREIAYQELGKEMLQRVEKDLENMVTIEQTPKMEGKQMTMVIAPKKK